VYAEPALVPASTWLDGDAPEPPSVHIARDSIAGADVVRLTPRGKQRVASWVVQSRVNDAWHTTILPGAERGHILRDDADADVVSVMAVDRSGNASERVIIQRARAGGTP
jgi:hypothetical protein